MVESTLFPAAFPSHHLLSAPRVAGLLPARAESLHKSVNPTSLLLTDYRLESIPPEHYQIFINATRRLFRAAADFLVSRNTDDETEMHMASLDFSGELSELFMPRVQIVTQVSIHAAAKAKTPNPPGFDEAIAELDARLEPHLRGIAEAAERLTKHYNNEKGGQPQ